MANFRVFEQLDQNLGDIAVNLDHVVRIERHEEDGLYRQSATRVLSAILILTDGTAIQTQIAAPFKDMAETELEGQFEAFVRGLNPGPADGGRRK